MGPDLVAAARLATRVNGGDASFAVADAAWVPFADASFDVVVGMNVLHHLSRPALARAVREAYRLLTPGGIAVFYEPVENSRVLGWLRDAIPAPATRKGRKGRPSILQRRAWQAYQAELDDRSLTTREIRRAAVSFAEVHARGYGVLVRLKRFVGEGRRKRLPELDARMLAAVPFLERFGRHVLVVSRKAPATAV